MHNAWPVRAGCFTKSARVHRNQTPAVSILQQLLHQTARSVTRSLPWLVSHITSYSILLLHTVTDCLVPQLRAKALDSA